MTDAHDETGTRKRLLLAADAFLFAAALTIVGSTLLIALNAVTGALDQDTTTATVGALAIQGGSLLLSLAAVGFGAVMAWRLHGRTLEPMVGLFMALGVIFGTPIAFSVFGALAFGISRIPIGTSEGPPWALIIVLAAAVLALLAVPMIDAIRDTRGPRAHTRLDTLRWIALAVVVVLAVIALPVLGAIGDSELGEAGIFMIPFSLAAVLAVLGGDLYCTFRDKRAATAAKVA